MGIRRYLKAKGEDRYADHPSYEVTDVVPPASPPKEGYVRQNALPHMNWNQFGPKGTEHNWTDLRAGGDD